MSDQAKKKNEIGNSNISGDDDERQQWRHRMSCWENGKNRHGREQIQNDTMRTNAKIEIHLSLSLSLSIYWKNTQVLVWNKSPNKNKNIKNHLLSDAGIFILFGFIMYRFGRFLLNCRRSMCVFSLVCVFFRCKSIASRSIYACMCNLT